jgi:hypothetical protein
MVFFTKKDIWLLTNRIDFLVVHFTPAKVVQFDPAKVVHFNPARVVYYDRFLQRRGKYLQLMNGAFHGIVGIGNLYLCRLLQFHLK